MEKTILLIEDDKTLSGPIKEALESEGFSVTLAEDGGEGIKQALSGAFAAILTDINLPAVSGYTILEKLRETEGGKSLPVIILTADDTNEDTLSKVTTIEPSYYIVKSTASVAEIVQKVKESLKAE